MAILELTLLRVVPPSSPNPANPTNTHTLSSLSPTASHQDLLATLSIVRTSLRTAGYPTHSRFYRSFTDPSQIYIFGIWETVKKHKLFLASDEARKILGPQEGVMDWVWGTHLDYSDKEPERWAEGWGDVVGILRVKVRDGGGEGVEEVLKRSLGDGGEAGLKILISGRGTNLGDVEVGEEVAVFQVEKKDNGDEKEGNWWEKWEAKVKSIEGVVEARGMKNMEN